MARDLPTLPLLAKAVIRDLQQPHPECRLEPDQRALERRRLVDRPFVATPLTWPTELESHPHRSRTRSRHPGWPEQQSDDCAGREELNVRAQAAGAMPAESTVEELAAAQPQPRKDVLEVGRTG